MTQLIIQFTAEGCGRKFELLLEDWGRYSRYLGCKGYASGNAPVRPKFIDEQSAAQIDGAMLKLKRLRPQLWTLVKLRYIHDMDLDDMVRALTRRRKRPRARAGIKRTRCSYGVTLAELDMRDRVDAKTLHVLLQAAVKMVFDWLTGL